MITSTRSLRAIASWQAHTDGLLGLEEWQDRIITFAAYCACDGVMFAHSFSDMGEITS